MELIEFFFHVVDQFLHCCFLLWVLLELYLIMSHIFDAHLIDALLRALVFECCVDTATIDIKKVKGVLLVKVGSPFAL